MAVFTTGGRAPKRINYVEYIQSTGTQYIDTGFIPGDSTFTIVMTGKNTASALSDENWFMTINYEKPAGTATFLQFGTWSSLFAVHLTNVIVNGTAAATFDKETLSFTVDGNVATLTSAGDTYSTTHDNFETGVYRYYPITIMTGLWALYSCQIYDNGTLVRDFWPCLDPNGVACLYDKVDKQYYYNAGTGEFTAG